MQAEYSFKQYNAGKTIIQIRDFLNEKGLKSARGGQMNFNNIQHMLHNRRYIGEFKYREIVVPDGIPAIVPKELFGAVQDKLDKNKKVHKSSKNGQ